MRQGPTQVLVTQGQEWRAAVPNFQRSLPPYHQGTTTTTTPTPNNDNLPIISDSNQYPIGRGNMGYAELCCCSASAHGLKASTSGCGSTPPPPATPNAAHTSAVLATSLP